ncbi:SDR family NAD(P)-dependent oxidoreductase [Pedobacter polaris]|uniref:SDR family NAD(P)-dependent oxidoreductase n=1 Tax=Pedobacter polaris TaxID=2571273 RepID=A0A4U1CRE7_9SPHI|nr:SDR family NAD(P)-dependent oxidoreductase [Pedobacter polaris]TKC08332.1 SDR family NAD(P)-dependent oxidoreductase [Pedobacter polaris]
MQKAIIIGATSGIGKALALLLADNGYKVGITGRRENLLAKLDNEKPDSFCYLAFDITAENLKENLNTITEKLGGLDLLIYSSGVGELNADLKIELELPAVDVNVVAFNKVMVWAYQYFAQQQSGQIAVISSIAGLRGGAAAPAYNASKAYQINYLEGLRQKAKQQKLVLTITDIRPGFVDTAMAKGEGKFWVAKPEKAATQIHNAIKAKKTVIYVTRRWRIIAWFLKILPRFLYERIR